MYTDNTTAYVELRQDLIRYAGKSLNHTEFRVMQFILERTLRFNKVAEKIPYRHFLEGFFNKKDDCCLAPIPGGRTALVDAMHSLEQKGLIKRTLSGDNPTTLITVAIQNIVEFLQMCALRLSKAYQNMSNTKNVIGGVGRNVDGGVGRNMDGGRPEYGRLYKGVEEGVEDKPVDFIPPAGRKPVGLSSSDTVNHVRTTHQQRRTLRLSATEAFSPKAFLRAYNDAVAQYAKEHGAVPITPVSSKEAHAFANSVSGVSLFKGEGWKDYIMDCIVNWDEYRDYLQRIWKTHSPPEIPVFRFFLTTQGRHYAPYYAARKSGDVERAKRITDGRVGSLRFKLDEQSRQIDHLREQLDGKDYTLQSLRKERDFSLSLQARKDRQPVRVYLSPTLTEEQFQRALTEDLPTWDDIERGKRNG